MATPQTSIPKGTRDFSPEEMARRNYIFNIIRKTFSEFGYMQIETPAMENLSTLLGKYGEEGDKLLFRILNSGDFMSKVDKSTNEMTTSSLAGSISEKGLKYDLTVPFARYVVQHRNDIIFPFRRYQIQPVWRADRPQKGRYREFYQCDADVIGSNSLVNEFELLQMIDTVFSRLGINIEIKLNNRKILSGLAWLAGDPELLTTITVAIDKADKTGLEKSMEELSENGLGQEAIDKIRKVIEIQGTNTEKLTQLKSIFTEYDEAIKGIEEIETISEYIKHNPLSCPVNVDLSLARGLNYYTGAIIEVKAKDVLIGSICGGGRYDNLTGIFGLPDISGVGISFGADRIADVMKELSLFPAETNTSTEVLFINFGEKEEFFCLKQIKKLREQGISCEIYPDRVKIKKQMSYADSRCIPYVVIAGESEINDADGKLKVKTMSSGKEEIISIEELAKLISDSKL